MKITPEIEIKLSPMPNFFRLANGTGVVAVTDISDDQLRGIGSQWAEALVKHAADRRALGGTDER